MEEEEAEGEVVDADVDDADAVTLDALDFKDEDNSLLLPLIIDSLQWFNSESVIELLSV